MAPMSMHAHRLYGLALALALSLCACAPPRQKVRLSITTDGDYLTYKPDTLTVPAGADVTLTFRHGGSVITQSHDWVLAKPGTERALMGEIDKAAAAPGSEGKSLLKPGDPRVLAATAPVAKGQSASVEFTAPPPGDYPFFCSTPGHGESMHGVLHVTAS
jgi:azurin